MNFNVALAYAISILAFQYLVSSEIKKKTTIQSVTFKFKRHEKNAYRSGKSGKK